MAIVWVGQPEYEQLLQERVKNSLTLALVILDEMKCSDRTAASKNNELYGAINYALKLARELGRL